MSDDQKHGEAEDIGLADPGLTAGEITDMQTEEIFEIGMGNQPCEAPEVKRECQRFVALMMRTQGHKYETIATEMGISTTWAWKLVKRGISMRQKEPVDVIRQMQVDRLETLLAAVWDRAEGGDSFAIQSALAIMDKIDKAHGIEPPKVVEHTFTKGARDAAVNELTSRIAALSDEIPDSTADPDPPDSIH